jgi:hypothetical protein
MPKNKPPKVLPAIKFDPPFSGDTGTGWRGEQGGAGKGDSLTGLQYNPINYYNPSARNMPEGTDMGNGQAAYPNPAYNPLPPAQPPAYGPRPDEYVQNPAFLQGRDEGATGALPNQQAAINGGQGAPGPNNPLGAGVNNPNEPAPMANQYNRLQDAVNKNQNLTQQAKDEGNDKEMKRLDDEWARLTSTPLYKQMYGGADEVGIKNRLINSYMQPDNEAAEPSFERAHARMVTDDWWAEEMTKAGAWTGDEFADKKLWDEHWHAMNKGGRDPLEGHPMAVQAIQAKMKEMEQANQQASYDSLQKWFTNSNPL